MDNNLVSCIIPTYKRNDSLLRAINSALNQTYKNIEVIVVDDNNPNDKYSKEVQKKLKTIKDPRLKYIQQEKHVNGAAARNVGIANASGEYIAFLDDDDEWLENKLQLQISKLQENPNANGISCYYTYCYNGIPIRKSPSYNEKNLFEKVISRSVSVCTPTLVFRKEALKRTGYFDETLARHQDLQLLLDFLSQEKLMVLPENLVLIHTEIGGNRPNTEKLIEVKNQFFSKMKHHFQSLDQGDRNLAYSAHYFEIIVIALKEKKFTVALKYLLKIGFKPRAYINLFYRILERKNIRSKFK